MEEEVMPHSGPIVEASVTMTVPRILLEILIVGDNQYKDGIRTYMEIVQSLITKSKASNRVRILYYFDKGEKTVEEKKQWLIENAKCKYYLFADLTKSPALLIKQSLNIIKKFEESVSKMKEFGINISKNKI